MTSTPPSDRTPAQRLALFAIASVIVLAAAMSLGYVTRGTSSATHKPVEASSNKSGEMDMGPGQSGAMTASDSPMGLTQSANGLTLLPSSRAVTQANATITFSIVDASSKPITKFDVEQTRQLHLIVVRHDFTNYQHLHPTLSPDGTWSVNTSFRQPGTYRVIADFTPTGKPRTILASDLAVGEQSTHTPASLPAARSNTALVDGYTVQLSSTRLAPGTENSLAMHVLQGGKPVQLEPYLGSYEHAVLVRVPDFAYLHVHPASSRPAEGTISFAVLVASDRQYVAFIQFKAASKVHTARFTMNAPIGRANTTSDTGTGY